MATSVTCLSRQEGVPPCLRTSPPLGGTLEVHRTSWRIPFPRHACTFLVLGFRGAWVSHAPPRVRKQRRPWDAALPPVSGSRLAGSPAWHGLPQCPGCGHWLSYCCAAFVFGSGLRLGVGFGNPVSPGWGLGWVCLGTVCGVVPLVSTVCGVRCWASFSACLWDVCGFVRAPLAPRRFWFRLAVWACVLGPGLGCAPPFSAGLSGCVFCAFFFFALSCRLLGVPVPGLVVPVPPSPFFRAGLLALFFFLRGVCLSHVSVSLFPVGRYSWLGVAGFGWVVPLCLFGGPGFDAFWGGVWPRLVVLAGGLVAVGCFRAPPPPPSVFLLLGGGLPVPPSAFPGLAHALARIQCCLPGCCWRLRSVWPCSGPIRRLGYVHVGLGAPLCRVGSWLCRLGGCARRLRVALG